MPGSGGTDWKAVLMPEFEVRKKRAQKTAFIGMLAERFGDRMRVETCGSLVKSRNIVIGDPETAKIIYTAHYDTCARLPVPNFITPRNIPVFLLYQVVISLLFAVPLFVLTFLAAWLGRGLPDLAGLFVTEGVLILGFAGILWLFFGGVPNPHTANDNTSGVVTVLTLADRLEGSSDAAFILFDNEEIGLLGSTGYAAAHKAIRDGTLLVNFDCVSDGPHFLILFSKDALKLPYCENLRNRAASLFGNADGKREDGDPARRVCEIRPKKGSVYPSDQAAFRVSAAVCALNESKTVGLYMDKIHTPKDTVFNADNIAALAELFAGAHEGETRLL